jgi:hypothetical protein
VELPRDTEQRVKPGSYSGRVPQEAMPRPERM